MPNDNIDANLFPPLPRDEIEDAIGFDNLERVVVTQNGVYGRSKGGGWVRLQPIAEITPKRT